MVLIQVVIKICNKSENKWRFKNATAAPALLLRIGEEMVEYLTEVLKAIQLGGVILPADSLGFV